MRSEGSCFRALIPCDGFFTGFFKPEVILDWCPGLSRGKVLAFSREKTRGRVRLIIPEEVRVTTFGTVAIIRQSRNNELPTLIKPPKILGFTSVSFSLERAEELSPDAA